MSTTKYLRLAAMKRFDVLCLLALVPFCTHDCVGEQLDVHVSLSKSIILLGEPVWVEITATNRTAQALAVGWGAACPDFGSTPIEIRVPDATQGDGEPKFCGAGGGSCMMPGPSTLSPGESESRRYVLSGNFRITQPGRYRVIVLKPLPWAPATTDHEVSLPVTHETQTVEFEGTLEVLPPDPARLLALEQAIAGEAAKPVAQLPANVPQNPDREAYMAALRVWSDANRKASATASRHRDELYEALAQYPASGMEPTYIDWQTPPNQIGSDYGISALKRLNTPESRKALAHLVEPLPERFRNGVRQTNSRWIALRALAGTGDRTYLPLIESYVNDPDPEVRRAAIIGMGELGGEDALSALDRIARQTTSQIERADAVSAMGRTKSAKAIPLLLELFSIPNPGDPTAPSFALTTLTHHSPPATDLRGTPAEMQVGWRAWWNANAKTAEIFGQYDCAEEFDR